ncbi:hypothetical protein QUA56_11620 [Microcoleus sp. N3A4]|uniref:hypothetical protein n=1 Tax=Microcoleus sp. N3A4 TaxID=3055379 RepID=UPI002FD4E899
MIAPILELGRYFVKTSATDKYKICIEFPIFWQQVLSECDRLMPCACKVDRPPAVAVFDLFKFIGTWAEHYTSKKNHNYNRFELVIGNWLF